MSASQVNRRRVVITGLGAITPLGLSVQETWKKAVAGQSGIGRITHFDPGDCPVQIAGEVKNFDPHQALHPLDSKDVKKLGRFTLLGLSAGLEAYRDSGLESVRQRLPPERFGINMGVGMGGFPEIEAQQNEFLEKGYRRISPFFVLQIIPNILSGQLGILLDMKGPNLCNATACATSAHSIGESFRQIQRGEADVMIAGGSEAVVSKLCVGGFAAMRALSRRNAEPDKASRPFDRDRDGFVMGEGAAALALEEYEFARARGARIYGELLGYGLTGDSYHLTSPAPDAAGAQRAMRMALTEASLRPEQIGYVNAHSTSTPLGDAEEARAIAKVFSDAARHLHVSSTKSMTGHMLGAAGAVEAVFSVLAIQEGRIPPTANLETVDPELAGLGLNFTPREAVDKKVDYVLSNSFGFGGTNGTLVIGRLA